MNTAADPATTTAVVSSVTALVVAVSGTAGGLFMLRANRRRSDAEAAQLRAQANRDETETRFTGTVYIKDMSEAAVALATARASENAELRAENTDLRDRVRELEKDRDDDRDKIEAVEKENAELRRELHETREEMARNNARFQQQMQQLMLRYGQANPPPSTPQA